MSDFAADAPKPSLGVLAILGDAMYLFLRNALLFIAMGLVVGIGLKLLSYVIFGAVLFVGPENMFLSVATILASASTILIALISSTLVTAIVTLAAFDSRQGKSTRLGMYISVVIKYLPAILVLSIVTGIAVVLGAMLLVVPGLYLFAMWAVVIPAIVIERAGFSALSRSQQLTMGYRWQILGLIILSFVLVAIINAVVALVLGLGFAAASVMLHGIFWHIFQAASNSVGSAFYAAIVVALFARLKEIKEGVGIEDLINVFD